MAFLKQGILVLGSAMAFASFPVVFASPASACPYGTTERFPGVCVNGAAQGGIPQAVVPPAAAPPSAEVVTPPGEFPRVNGIPCTPENYGKCIALQQSQG